MTVICGEENVREEVGGWGGGVAEKEWRLEGGGGGEEVSVICDEGR